MLTENQEKYILTIPEDKIINIQPFDPKVKEAADIIILEIKNVLPDLEIHFGGASALGIAGQNDIDINLLSTPEEYDKYIPSLVRLYGEPIKKSEKLIKWELERNRFEVELYLTDKDSPALQEQIKTFEIIRDNSDLKKEYEEMKISSNGLPFREYMKRKYEFFNRINSLN
jgi:GrpB-like predicted nucleotidyltransferase (UPF0157 family)